jgi:hypothetical protein
VYCEGRISAKEVPKLPNLYSYVAQLAAATLGTMDLYGQLSVYRVSEYEND